MTEHWPDDAAIAVAAVLDPITLTRIPDMQGRVMRAFTHASHDYKAWWFAFYGNRVGQRVLDSTGAPHDVVVWCLAAAFHAVIIGEVPLTEANVEALTRDALAWHLTKRQEYG